MMVISFIYFGNSARGKTLEKITCLTLMRIVCREGNARIFWDTWKKHEMM